jgi:hypothetical protein
MRRNYLMILKSPSVLRIHVLIPNVSILIIPRRIHIPKDIKRTIIANEEAIPNVTPMTASVILVVVHTTVLLIEVNLHLIDQLHPRGAISVHVVPVATKAYHLNAIVVLPVSWEAFYNVVDGSNLTGI